MRDQNEGAEVFVWSAKYETGIDLVNTQHKGLVGIINRVGEASQQSLEPGGIEPILDELAAYARDHFAMEHRLMRDAGLHEPFVHDHVATHGSFVKQLDLMRSCMRDAPDKLLPGLLRYLITWLAEHILVEDQAMAWQVRAVQGGMSAEAANAWASGKANPSHDALVEAMHRMYAEIAQRNAELSRANERLREREQELEQTRRELARFNAGLGARVAERTAEVYETQLRLQQEYDAQRALARQLEQLRRELEGRSASAAQVALIESASRDVAELARLVEAPGQPEGASVSAREAIERLLATLATMRNTG